MQICSATIRLAGSVQNTVYREDITPPEILVLQAIHGQDAVIDIVPIENVERSQNAEWSRLTAAYDRSGGPDTPDGREEHSIVARLFPGAVKRLPVSLKEIGHEDREAPEAIAEEAPKPRGGRPRKAADPAAVIAAAPLADAIAPEPQREAPPVVENLAPTFIEGDDAEKPATDPVGDQWKANAESHAAALEGLTNDAIEAD